MVFRCVITRLHGHATLPPGEGGVSIYSMTLCLTNRPRRKTFTEPSLPGQALIWLCLAAFALVAGLFITKLFFGLFPTHVSVLPSLSAGASTKTKAAANGDCEIAVKRSSMLAGDGDSVSCPDIAIGSKVRVVFDAKVKVLNPTPRSGTNSENVDEEKPLSK